MQEKTQEEMRLEIQEMMRKANGQGFAADVVERTASTVAAVAGFNAAKKDNSGVIVGFDPIGACAFGTSLAITIAAMNVRRTLANKREAAGAMNSKINEVNSNTLGDRLTVAMNEQTQAIVAALEKFGSGVEEVDAPDSPNCPDKLKTPKSKKHKK